MASRIIARLFDSYADAAAAVRDLEAAGFMRDDISLVARGAEEGTTTTTDDTTPASSDTGAASGGGTGATIGTLVGGGAGLLAGIGALAIPGLGPVVAAGWLVAALTGAGVGAAAGGLLGALTQAGIGEEQAEVYAEGVRRGGNLVTVRTEESRASEVKAVMLRHNGQDTDVRSGRWSDSGWTRHDAAADPASGLGTEPASAPPRRAARWVRAPAWARAPMRRWAVRPMGRRATRRAPWCRAAWMTWLAPMSAARVRRTRRAAAAPASAAAAARRTGTPGNPPGTKVSRGIDEAAGTNISGAHPENETRRGGTGLGGSGSAPDGTPGNPPGTKVSRGIDEAAGTNISGAHPENETGARRNPNPSR